MQKIDETTHFATNLIKRHTTDKKRRERKEKLNKYVAHLESSDSCKLRLHKLVRPYLTR